MENQDIGLNKYTLRFPGKLENEFTKYYFSNSIRQIRAVIWFGLAIFLLFGLLDYIMLQDFTLSIILRLAIALPYSVFLVASLNKEFLRRFYDYFMSVWIIIGGVGSIFVIIEAENWVRVMYFAGPILVIFFGLTLTHTRFLTATVTSWIILGLYLLSAVYIMNVPSDALINNMFFMVSACIIGSIACYTNEYFVRRNFFVSRLLREEKSKTEALLANERELNLMKSEFISLVSHEYRTPLSIILSSKDIIVRAINAGKLRMASKHLTRIDEAVTRMTLLLQNVTTYGKFESDKINYIPEQFNLIKLIDSIAEGVTGYYRTDRLIMDYPTDEIILHTDDSILEIILRNLMDNAFKFSQSSDIPVEIFVSSQSDAVTIKVEDRGIGIPNDEIKDLFLPFHKMSNATNIVGNGLGLSVSKKCADMINADLEIISELDKGTTAILKVPIN